jgi:hypothetical protein
VRLLALRSYVVMSANGSRAWWHVVSTFVSRPRCLAHPSLVGKPGLRADLLQAPSPMLRADCRHV